MKVEIIKQPTVITSESLMQYLADVSSVVRGSQPKDNERLFKRLMKESYGNKPSRLFEYIACAIPYTFDVLNTCELFGFRVKDTYCTSARELLNWGWSWKQVIEYVDFTHYRAVRVTSPRFIYNQLQTHTQITSVCFSARYSDQTAGYWKPDEVEMSKIVWDAVVDTSSPLELRCYMKDNCDIKRKEIYNRGADSLAYVTYSLGGWMNSSNSWEHFINQRAFDSHTQLETREVAKMISELL